jgi:hypothetical protein
LCFGDASITPPAGAGRAQCDEGSRPLRHDRRDWNGDDALVSRPQGARSGASTAADCSSAPKRETSTRLLLRSANGGAEGRAAPERIHAKGAAIRG